MHFNCPKMLRASFISTRNNCWKIMKNWTEFGDQQTVPEGICLVGKENLDGSASFVKNIMP